MGKKCCVPNCRGNYDESEKVSVFLFPKDEERKSLWMNKIPRDNFVPSATTVVCERHFLDSFIIRIDSATRPDGSILTVPRSKPKLSDDAYPSLFPNCPSYLSETTPLLKRKKPEDRRHEIEARDNNAFVEWLEKDKIIDFSHFNEDFKTRVDGTWLYRFHHDNNISDQDQQSVSATDSSDNSHYWSFYQIFDDLESAPHLMATVKVFTDMHVEIFTSKSGRVPKASLSWIFDKPQTSILRTWSQFDTILSHFSNGNSGISHDDLDKKLELLMDIVEEICSVECEDAENNAKKDRLIFLVQQMKLCLSSSRKYSCYTLIWAFKIHALAPRAYTIMRTSYLTLPHPSYLRKLASVFNIRSGLTDENIHKEYLKQKCSNLAPRERTVILMLDEIHLSQHVSYKEGKLEGSAVNCPIAEASIDRQLQVEASSECYSYISALDRGGLKWPSDFVLSIVIETFKVFQFLIGSSSHEEKLLSCSNQRLLVTKLVKQRLRELNLLGRKCQECEKDHADSVSKICKPAVNIFLNNYSKNLADRNVTSKNERKLKTFSKRV